MINNYNKWLLITVIFIIAVFSITACGKKASSSTTTPSNTITINGSASST